MKKRFYQGSVTFLGLPDTASRTKCLSNSIAARTKTQIKGPGKRRIETREREADGWKGGRYTTQREDRRYIYVCTVHVHVRNRLPVRSLSPLGEVGRPLRRTVEADGLLSRYLPLARRLVLRLLPLVDTASRPIVIGSDVLGPGAR